MKKPLEKRAGLKKAARAHGVFFLISFGLYTALSAILMPSFILSDMRNKSTALADETIALMGKVLAPPVEPVISGSSVCNNGILVVNLDWLDDENSLTFDINRNGATLITGITNSQYTDNNITPGTSYIYTLIAHGPMGPGLAVSQPATISTVRKCGIAPETKITSFQNRPIINSVANKTTSLKPTFSGITNIPYAKIFITLTGGPEITAIIYANENGYWSWSCPEKLNYGEHSLYATASDPANPALISMDTLNFAIIQETKSQIAPTTSTEKTTPRKKFSTPLSNSTLPAPVQTPTAIANVETAPLIIAVKVENPNQTVYAGDSLLVHTEFITQPSSLTDRDYEIIYNVLDSNDRLLSEISEKINPAQINSIKKNIPIPVIAKAEKYKIIVKIYNGPDLIESEVFFQVKELPIISVGATTISLTQIMQSLGWISLLLFLFFLILLGIEHHQSKNALFQITENYLRRNGFFTRRKGMSS